MHELGLDDEADTLARWMAHHIAELIADAEVANPTESQAKAEKCFAAILDLWKHRWDLPKGKRPFERLGPVFKILESLDLETRNTFRYELLDDLLRNGGPESGADNDWLDTAKAIDYSARLLIRYCVAMATEGPMENAEEWAKLATAAGLEDDLDLIIIRFISDERDLLKGTSTDALIRKHLEDRLRRLDEFTQLSTRLRSELRDRLNVLDGKAETPSQGNLD